MDLRKLLLPFEENEIEWRIGRAGISANGKIWASVLAYITNRAIMDRLDSVCGQENWKNEFVSWKGTSQLCGISIKINNEWITKWDGAGDTEIEGIKGGLSDSMKRSAVQWGIGRYLYDLPDMWADCFGNGSGMGKNKGSFIDKSKTKQYFEWNPPLLPDNFLPAKENKNPDNDTKKPEKKIIMPEKFTNEFIISLKDYFANNDVHTKLNEQQINYFKPILGGLIDYQKEAYNRDMERLIKLVGVKNV